MSRTTPNPFFAEFLYEILRGITVEQRRRLSPKHQKIMLKDTSAKKWIETAKEEEKQEVLALLGIEYFYCFFDRGRIGQARYLRDIFKKFNEDAKAAELKEIVEKRIYVTSDRELVHGMGLRASLINTSAYVRNMDILKAGYHFGGWGKKLGSDLLKNISEDSDSAAYLAQTALSAIHANLAAETTLQIKDTDLQILLFLYPQRNTYIPFNKIRGKFLHLKIPKVTVALKRLMECQYVHRPADIHDRSYQISSLGISKVNEALHYMLKNNSI